MIQAALSSEIRRLSVSERLELLEQIWRSIVDDESRFELGAAHKAELDRRLERRAASPTPGAVWEDVKQRILGES